jgi:hypothetical protein
MRNERPKKEAKGQNGRSQGKISSGSNNSKEQRNGNRVHGIEKPPSDDSLTDDGKLSSHSVEKGKSQSIWEFPQDKWHRVMDERQDAAQSFDLSGFYHISISSIFFERINEIRHNLSRRRWERRSFCSFSGSLWYKLESSFFNT